MNIVCLDLEGVLIPEIWINFAERTGIDELRVTTREIADYDELMTKRLGILREHKLGLPEIQEVIGSMDPLPGAREFVDGLRDAHQLIILSDTFYEFGMPMMRKLGMPTLFCHKLVVADSGEIRDYTIRQKDPKRAAVRALQGLNFKVTAAGDSYNDTTMLEQADTGFLFRSPDNVISEFPQFSHTEDYDVLRQRIDDSLK